MLIPIDIIIKIILNYYTAFEQWKTSRLLNTTTKRLTDNQKYDELCFGRRTFIMAYWCSICEKKKMTLIGSTIQ